MLATERLQDYEPCSKASLTGCRKEHSPPPPPPPTCLFPVQIPQARPSDQKPSIATMKILQYCVNSIFPGSLLQTETFHCGFGDTQTAYLLYPLQCKCFGWLEPLPACIRSKVPGPSITMATQTLFYFYWLESLMETTTDTMLCFLQFKSKSHDNKQPPS